MQMNVLSSKAGATITTRIAKTTLIMVIKIMKQLLGLPNRELTIFSEFNSESKFYFHLTNKIMELRSNNLL